METNNNNSIEETKIRGVGTDFRLNPELEGKNSYVVAEWLKCLFGKENYELGCKWLAYSLDFTNPISVFSIQSASEAGKSLVVRGLANCLEIPDLCRRHEFAANSSDWALRTPFVNIDESWSSCKDKNDKIRRWTGGGVIPVKKKYCGQVKVNNPARIILTSNSSSLVDELLNEYLDLTNEDVQALNERILHIKAPTESPKHIGFYPSVKEISEHIKHLYDHRERLFGKPGSRYTVSGLEGGEQLKANPSIGEPLTLKTLQKTVHSMAVEKGWWEGSNEHPVGWWDKKRNFGEICSLFHSEVSEAFEAHRHNNPPSDHIPEFTGIEEELADVVIRVADYAEAVGIDLETVVKAKIEYNAGRSYRHGGKTC